MNTKLRAPVDSALWVLVNMFLNVPLAASKLCGVQISWKCLVRITQFEETSRVEMGHASSGRLMSRPSVAWVNRHSFCYASGAMGRALPPCGWCTLTIICFVKRVNVDDSWCGFQPNQLKQ